MTTRAPADQAALDLLFDVLRVNSVWGEERALAELLGRKLQDSGFADVALVEPLPGRPSVCGRLPGRGGGRSLILNGHIDIYELAADWTRDPFAPVLEDGKIYGAGVADEKAGTAALLAAALQFVDPVRRPRGDIVFMGVSAHFEGGLGTRAVLARGISADAAICCEPSAMRLCNAHRGAAYLTITTRGRQAHTTSKHLGLNAIETMIPIMLGLETLEIPFTPDDYGGPVLNIGTIQGGTKHNQVPDRCTISIDVRVPASTSPEQAKDAVEQLIARLQRERPEIDADVAFSPYWLSGPRYPTATPIDAPIVATLQRAREHAGLPPAAPMTLPVWADMCVLDRAGIPTVNIGPGGEPYNWADEYVAVDEYLAAVRTYAAAIADWCN